MNFPFSLIKTFTSDTHYWLLVFFIPWWYWRRGFLIINSLYSYNFLLHSLLLLTEAIVSRYFYLHKYSLKYFAKCAYTLDYVLRKDNSINIKNFAGGHNPLGFLKDMQWYTSVDIYSLCLFIGCIYFEASRAYGKSHGMVQSWLYFFSLRSRTWEGSRNTQTTFMLCVRTTGYVSCQKFTS